VLGSQPCRAGGSVPRGATASITGVDGGTHHPGRCTAKEQQQQRWGGVFTTAAATNVQGAAAC